MGSTDTKEARIKNLTDAQLARKKQTKEKVDKAIEHLFHIGAKITFQTVAREASVSVPYLYKYPELKAYIAQLRLEQQFSIPASPKIEQTVTLKAHSQIVERLKKRIYEIEKENIELKRKNEALAGQLYKAHSLRGQVDRQREIIEALENRLKIVSQQITDNKVSVLRTKPQIVSNNILDELDQLEIQVNDNLINQIKAATESDVLAAIEYYKYELERTYIENPGGWLARAIKGRWKKPNNLQKTSSSEKSLQQQSVLSLSNQLDRKFASHEEIASISAIFEEKSND